MNQLENGLGMVICVVIGYGVYEIYLLYNEGKNKAKEIADTIIDTGTKIAEGATKAGDFGSISYYQLEVNKDTNSLVVQEPPKAQLVGTALKAALNPATLGNVVTNTYDVLKANTNPQLDKIRGIPLMNSNTIPLENAFQSVVQSVFGSNSPTSRMI
jgi:hypothetical protein